MMRITSIPWIALNTTHGIIADCQTPTRIRQKLKARSFKSLHRAKTGNTLQERSTKSVTFDLYGPTMRNLYSLEDNPVRVAADVTPVCGRPSPLTCLCLRPIVQKH